MSAFFSGHSIKNACGTASVIRAEKRFFALYTLGAIFRKKRNSMIKMLNIGYGAMFSLAFGFVIIKFMLLLKYAKAVF